MRNIDALDETASPKPWGVIATALWGLLTLFISGVVMVATLVLLAGGQLSRSQDLGPLVWFATLVWTMVQVEVLALAARRRGWQAAEYLGWVVPKPRDVAVTLTVIVLFGLASEALEYLLDRQMSAIDTYRSAREAGWLVMLWIAWVIAGPLSEELLFRGFLYRGWAQSRRAVMPAVVVISALWAILHVEYDWFLILEIFLTGLVLGWARWRSGSTMLTFAMHAFVNTWVIVKLHWLT